jgi:hypothetical protein
MILDHQGVNTQNWNILIWLYYNHSLSLSTLSFAQKWPTCASMSSIPMSTSFNRLDREPARQRHADLSWRD